MGPKEGSGSDVAQIHELGYPWDGDIWQEDCGWFELAEMLWVKLFGTTMEYGILNGPIAQNVDVVMNPALGILLVSEVYESPGRDAWTMEDEVERMIMLSGILSTHIATQLKRPQEELGIGYAVVLRDMDRRDTYGYRGINPWTTIARDELAAIVAHLERVMSHYTRDLSAPFSEFGAAVISCVKEWRAPSSPRRSGFMAPEDILEYPELPTWLRCQ